MPEEEIKLYGTTWCPDTARAVNFLKSHNIRYIWCDIEQDEKGCAYVEKINHGNRTIPTIVFPDGSILVEPSDSELAKKCKVKL